MVGIERGRDHHVEEGIGATSDRPSSRRRRVPSRSIESVKCRSPRMQHESFGSAGNFGRPSSAMFTLPDEPRILKFLTCWTKAVGQLLLLDEFEEGALHVGMLETTRLPGISSPLLRARRHWRGRRVTSTAVHARARCGLCRPMRPGTSVRSALRRSSPCRRGQSPSAPTDCRRPRPCSGAAAHRPSPATSGRAPCR